MDAHGDLFIADTYNNVVREVTPNGIITTIAGNGYSGTSRSVPRRRWARPPAAELDAPVPWRWTHRETCSSHTDITDTSYQAMGNFTTDLIFTACREVSPPALSRPTRTFSVTLPTLGRPTVAAGILAPSPPGGVAVDGAGDLFLADTGPLTRQRGTGAVTRGDGPTGTIDGGPPPRPNGHPP